MMTFDPSDSTWPTTFEFRPFTTAPIAITVLTPITIPSTVRNDRSGFLRRASSASPIASLNSPSQRVLRTAPAFHLLGMQGDYRIEARRLRRRIYSEEQSDARRDHKTEHDRPGVDRARQRCRPGHNFCHENSENHAPEAANRGDRR